MFRRGSRHEAPPPEKSSPQQVDQPPYWLAGVEAKPGRAGTGVALLGDDQPHRPAEQQREKGQSVQHSRPSPLRGVSTQEVIEALSRPFSPPELDWELVGVAFVHPEPTAAEPDPDLQVWLVEERPDGVLVEEQVDLVVVDEPGGGESVEVRVLDEPPDDGVANEQADSTLVDAATAEAVVEEVAEQAEMGPIVAEPIAPIASERALSLATAGKRKRKHLREQAQIMAAVRELSWEGYCSLIADIFRREGYDVFVGEGADGDVIDMEVVYGDERMLVNCQLRGMTNIDAAPVAEMTQVAARNGAAGAFLISDGTFDAEAWSFTAGQPVVLVDGEALFGLVLDFTLGAEREKRLSARLARLLRGQEPRTKPKAS